MNKKLNKNADQTIAVEEILPSDNKVVKNLMQKLNDEPDISKINGVAIGKLISLDINGKAFVDYNLNPQKEPLEAVSTISLYKEDISKEVALIFQDGSPYNPLIIGFLIQNKDNRILVKDDSIREDKEEPIEILVDKKRITFNAEKEITFKCGKASITLTSAGKILIRGKYLLSRSSGVNRIKGGSVQIN